MAHPRSRRLIVALTTLSLLATACGGGDDESGDPTTTTTTTAGESTTTSTEAPTDDGTTTTTTTTTATTVPEADPIPVMDADEIPGLVRAWGDAEGTPRDLAEMIIGFPVAVDPPAGATAYNLRLDMDGENPDEPWQWEWSYQATIEGELADIDLDQEDWGPGTVELMETYDPILADLGWSYSNQTGSDPGDPGGPMSVNRVYTYDEATFALGEIDATPDPLFVWADEELIFGEGIAGYQFDVGMQSQPNFIPVPMLEALFREVPVAPGARLTEIDVDTWQRPEDSFDAEYGLRYIQIEYTCELLPNSAPQAHETYSVGLAGSVYQPGDESFFDPGFVEFEEPLQVSDTEWQQNVIVLDRYPGRIEVITDPETGAVTSTVSMTLEPNRVELQPLPDE